MVGQRTEGEGRLEARVRRGKRGDPGEGAEDRGMRTGDEGLGTEESEGW
jgi:hypothetical protein